MKPARGATGVGGAAIVVVGRRLPRAVRLHRPAWRSRTGARPSRREFSWPNGLHLWDNLVDGDPDAQLHAAHRLRQLHHPHRGQRRRCWSSSAPWSATCCSAAGRGWTPVVNFCVLAGLIIPPAVVPTIWVLQGLDLFKTHARHDPDRGRLRPLVHDPALPRLHRHHSARARRGRDHRRRRARCASSSG